MPMIESPGTEEKRAVFAKGGKNLQLQGTSVMNSLKVFRGGIEAFKGGCNIKRRDHVIVGKETQLSHGRGLKEKIIK